MYRQAHYKVAGSLYKDTNIQQSSLINNPPSLKEHFQQKNIPSETTMNWETITYADSADPNVWGPSFWYILHNSSARYPENASPIVIEQMKGFILGMPLMIPCDTCAEHARAHIEKNYHRLNDVCSGKDELFKFFWEFHRFVNSRYNKPNLSLEEAWKKYTSKINVTRMVYK